MAITLGIAPRLNAQHVAAFCAQVNPGARPAIVGVQPQLPVVDNECFDNARRHAAQLGGDVVHGWAIWEIPRLMIEAEFHAVWRTPGGTLFDVNPRPKYERQILFLPQPELAHDGHRDNIRHALKDHPTVHAFIALAERRFEFLRRFKPGVLRFTKAEWDAAFPDEFDVGTRFFRLAAEHRDGKDHCVCGSGKQFRKCHRDDLFAQFREADRRALKARD